MRESEVRQVGPALVEAPRSWYFNSFSRFSSKGAEQTRNREQPFLAFGLQQAQHLYMTPRGQKTNPTAGALRAARAIQADASRLESLPELIDRETGVREVLEILQSIISQAGDLIESRSPELVAEARAALTRYKEEAPGQAE